MHHVRKDHRENVGCWCIFKNTSYLSAWPHKKLRYLNLPLFLPQLKTLTQITNIPPFSLALKVITGHRHNIHRTRAISSHSEHWLATGSLRHSKKDTPAARSTSIQHLCENFTTVLMQTSIDVWVCCWFILENGLWRRSRGKMSCFLVSIVSHGFTHSHQYSAW